MRKLRMILNGSPVELEVDEARYLSEVLRGELGLRGTKIGCNEAECGICTVLVILIPPVLSASPGSRGPGSLSRHAG